MSSAELAKGVQRRDVSIPVGPERLAAWWYPPAGERAKAPCVVMAHGFAAIKEMRLGAYAERFAEAGFGALIFDYRHFGQSTGEPRNLLDPRVQQEDWRAAVAYARDLPEVSHGPNGRCWQQMVTFSTRLKTVAYTVCGSLGLDASGYLIPYLASWFEVATLETIESVAHLIDRLARRIEDAVDRGVAESETPLAA